MLKNEQLGGEERAAEVGHLEERLCADEENSKSLRVVRAHGKELTAERASLTTVTEQAKEGFDTLAAPIQELILVGVKCIEELRVVVLAVRSLKARVPAGEESVTAEAWTRKTLHKMYELRGLVQGWRRTVGDTLVCAAGLVDPEMIGVLSIITTADRRVKEWSVRRYATYITAHQLMCFLMRPVHRLRFVYSGVGLVLSMTCSFARLGNCF